MTYDVLMWTLYPTHSLTLSLWLYSFVRFYLIVFIHCVYCVREHHHTYLLTTYLQINKWNQTSQRYFHINIGGVSLAMMLYINQRWYWHYDLSVESDSSPQKREQNAVATVVLESRHNRSSVSSVGSLLSRKLNLPRLLTKYHTQSLAAFHTLRTLWHHKPPRSMRTAYTHLFTVPRQNLSFSTPAFRISASKIWKS